MAERYATDEGPEDIEYLLTCLAVSAIAYGRWGEDFDRKATDMYSQKIMRAFGRLSLSKPSSDAVIDFPEGDWTTLQVKERYE